MPISFLHLTESMRVTLTRKRGTAGHHEAAAKERLSDDSRVQS
jgi:hypothetical protein